MIFKKHGLSVWITDSDKNELPEHLLQEISDNTIQCWIPSRDGVNFQIQWKLMQKLHPEYDIGVTPYLDGVRMTGMVRPKERLFEGYSTKHSKERTGSFTARLYEFGNRTLTDDDDCLKPPQSLLENLNTIKLTFEWGHREGTSLQPRKTFHVPHELGPIHEKAAKKGHSGAAKLGKTVTTSTISNDVRFVEFKGIKPVSFVFRYAPEGTHSMRARGIIPRSPEPEPQGTHIVLKRERSITPNILDVDELETDDDEIQIVKHMVPAPAISNKRQRTSGSGSAVKIKNEGD
ncbi:hypothetical protein V565_009760 [Rhizoctonia solani 123E]|uniref:DUF7918 domain-containing protein n=1 Tax=Rhizoctonia solani 123E TaxID=1423351 RepID=A0A074S6C4_9AGAM|nr:hypothetical protein V565_009760 [Rhizoctonia solani 123E]